MINIAMVGLGYWGPNLLRNLAALEGVNVSVICDKDTRRAEMNRKRLCPKAAIVSDVEEIGNNPAIDAVVIATPIRTHYDLGKYFLERGKHVFIEKPLAETEAQCSELAATAEKKGLVLMVGHIFEYSIPVQRIKQYIDSGDLGKIFYVYSQRLNLGRIQNDINALWSFAPHDISILNYWTGQQPVRVAAQGFSFLNTGVEDVVFVTLEYPDGIKAHMHLGWLDPRKVRMMTVVGSKKMLVYDDVSIDAKIQIYDKGIVDLHDYLEMPESFAQFQFQIRTGDLVVPTIQFGEPLQTECRHFIDCIVNKKQPLTDGRNGMRVVKVLEAAAVSIRNGGSAIDIN